MLYDCPQYISEDRRFGLQITKVTLTVNEFITAILLGVMVWFVTDLSQSRWWLSMISGLGTWLGMLAVIGKLSEGKPGSYLWDIQARFGLAGGPGAIRRSRYRCANYPFIGNSKLGIWGGTHVGPSRREHAVVPPSRLMGHCTRLDVAPANHYSLTEIFELAPPIWRRVAVPS